MNLTCFKRSHLAQLDLGILLLMVELGKIRNINLCPVYATLKNS